MRLKKITIKNIRSYKDEEIIFPEGSLLLSGDIGSGKTSILLAIEYALFGLQPGQKGSALLRNESDFAEVSLDLEIERREITIERKLKRSSKGVANEYSAISIDGEKFESSTTEIKTKILNLLCYPAEFIKKNNLLYRYTVYTPQEQMKQIILEDSETRLNVIRHIFGIDKYRRMSDNLVIVLSHLKEDSKVIQGEIKELDNDKSRLSIIGDRIKKLNNFIQEREISVQKLKKARQFIESEVVELEGKKKERENLFKEIEKTKIMVSSKKENVLLVNKEILEVENLNPEKVFDENKFNILIKDLESKKSAIDTFNSQYIEFKSSLNSFSKQITEMLASKERIFQIDICPTCLQDVPEVHKHNILNNTEKNLVELKQKIIFLEERKSQIENQIKIEKLNLDKLAEEKLSLEILKSKKDYFIQNKKKKEEALKRKESLEKDIILLSSHLESLKEGTTELSKFENIYQHKQTELKNAFREEKNAEIFLAESKKEIEMTIKEESNLISLITQKENSKKKLSELLELTDWLSTRFLGLVDFTERNVMIKLRREFSKLFSKWFSMLVADSSFEVQLDEKFTPVLMQRETEMDYSFLSGGERTAIALAYRLALNQTINLIYSQIKTGDLVILDEPTEGFSENQLDKMRDVLSELNVNQLIIVSHEQKMESFVDKVIRLKKTGDSSYLEKAQEEENFLP
ncbi:MAG: hypothetical protein Q8L29_03235 [archaeon]|nr:hypothetical protein [archaeon]